jgi:hypothetical protein
MTLMVRDEADIVAAMIEHHLAQGVDLIIATDNGSVDGTREILAEYAATGRLELHDEPVQMKQQSTLVTAMARRAFTFHAADWVINADADEFWFPVDRSLTLRSALERIPTSLLTWSVPVVNLSGVPARRGSGIRRLDLRDERPSESLDLEAGLHSQPTSDAIHVGYADISVVQGNHSVNLTSAGEPDPALALEVLHLPWRSWEQYSHKVEVTGVAYESNPNVKPSPRHHGMRDYRRLRAGYLLDFYALRHAPIGDPAPVGFTRDRSLVDELESLDALRPELLARALDDAVDEPLEAADQVRARTLADIVLPLEIERNESLTAMRNSNRGLSRRLKEAERRIERLTEQKAELKRRLGELPAAPSADSAAGGSSFRRMLGGLKRRFS